MGIQHKPVLAIVLAGLLGLAAGATAGARVISTPADCHATFQAPSLYNACMNCVKAHRKFKLDSHNAWGCK